MKKILVCAMFVFFSILSNALLAVDDMVIYAQDDKTYTYKNKNYTLKEFPIDSVISEHNGGDSVIRDSVVPVTVSIYPTSQVELEQLRMLVRPLALKFHRKGAKVNTMFFNKVIPYTFKKRPIKQ